MCDSLNLCTFPNGLFSSVRQSAFHLNVKTLLSSKVQKRLNTCHNQKIPVSIKKHPQEKPNILLKLFFQW